MLYTDYIVCIIVVLYKMKTVDTEKSKVKKLSRRDT